MSLIYLAFTLEQFKVALMNKLNTFYTKNMKQPTSLTLIIIIIIIEFLYLNDF